MSVMLAAASSLSWAAELIGRGDHIGAVIEGAEAFARSADAVASAPIYLPYLSGERTPHNDAQATGIFAGLRASHGQDALIYAVLEGVAFSFADGTDVLAEAGAKPATPLFVGGGARSGFWGQLISDATGLTIDRRAGRRGGRGARRRPARHAGGRGKRHQDDLRAAADAAPVQPSRGKRRGACAPPATLSRTLWSRKSRAIRGFSPACAHPT